ncbi:peptidoglycan DD-metalloendopeptidase family protein [soil metagenome]
MSVSSIRARCRKRSRDLAGFAGLIWAVAAVASPPTAYKYRNADGNWVFTDRRPGEVAEVEEQALATRAQNPDVAVHSEKTADGASRLIVDNRYVAPVEILLELTGRVGVSPDVPDRVRTVVPPSTRQTVLEVYPREPRINWSFGYDFRYMPGNPDAVHDPPVPYRAPFTPATSFTVSQAYPSAFSHQDEENRYAVDFAMPIGTPVYAAREGLVMEVAGQFFESGMDPAEHGSRANLVRVLHADGTMAIYAHLNWESVRVVPGAQVHRGQYIADSGNTGFSTGPHLHFVVQRNAGFSLVSVPVKFAAGDGAAVTPRTGAELAAY